MPDVGLLLPKPDRRLSPQTPGLRRMLPSAQPATRAASTRVYRSPWPGPATKLQRADDQRNRCARLVRTRSWPRPLATSSRWTAAGWKAETTRLPDLAGVRPVFSAAPQKERQAHPGRRKRQQQVQPLCCASQVHWRVPSDAWPDQRQRFIRCDQNRDGGGGKKLPALFESAAVASPAR